LSRGISVVITALNEVENVPHLLDSLSVQEPPFEIVFVDAGSDDGTVEVVEKYARTMPGTLRLLVREDRPSRGEARNLGVGASKYDLVAFIDADAIANPFWLREIRRSFMEGADVVAGKVINIGYKPFEELERVELEYKGLDVSYPSCNLAYRKDLFLRLGGFDPSFVTAEDIDLNMRAVDAGARIVYNPRAIVYHRTRPTIGRFLLQAFWNGYGRKMLTRKHGKLWKYYKASKIIRKNLSFWAMARMAFALLGYLACKIYG